MQFKVRYRPFNDKTYKTESLCISIIIFNYIYIKTSVYHS